jgi:hypothetical protein
MLCLLFGPIVWAVHLTAIYASHAALCARGTADFVSTDIDAPMSIVIVTTVLALVVMTGAVLMLRTATRKAGAIGQPDEERSFHCRVTVSLIMLSALAVVWAGAAAAVIPACAPLR